MPIFHEKKNLEQMFDKVKKSMNSLQWNADPQSPLYHKYLLSQIPLAERAFQIGDYNTFRAIIQKMAAACYYEGAKELESSGVIGRQWWGIR